MSDVPVREITYPGPPTHGSYNLGDQAVDSNGVLWRCTLGGLASTTATFVSDINAMTGTTALGNGSSGNLTALAKGTGTGPASDVVNAWIPVTINGTAGWIPFFV
jgi:hypothetical protein